MRSRHKWLLGILLSLLVPATAFGAQEPIRELPTFNVLVNGTPLQAVLLDGQAMLSLQSLADAIGATVQWDLNSDTAVLITGGNAPVAAPPPLSHSRIDVISYSYRTTKYGSPWAYAELRNSGETPVEDIKVSMLATKDGNIVATGSESLGSRAVLRPGQTASVWVKPSNEIPQGATLEWTFSSEPSTREVPRLQLNGTAVTEGDFGWAHGIGSITNTDNRKVENLQVTVGFHNADGRILYSSMDTDVALRTLEPGQTTVFDATATDISAADVSDAVVYLTASYADAE